jgi:hypothetical protein
MDDKINRQQVTAFMDMLAAGILDAACERKMTQMKTTCLPPGRTKPELVRIVIMPETMDHEWSQPLRKSSDANKA